MNQRLIWPPSCFMIDYILSVIYHFIGFFYLYDIGLTLLYEKIKFSYPNKPKTWIVGGYFFRHFVWSREYWSHNFKQGIKRKDFLYSTTMVYHSHMEKCHPGVENDKNARHRRPFWKMAATATLPPTANVHHRKSWSTHQYGYNDISHYI